MNYYPLIQKVMREKTRQKSLRTSNQTKKISGMKKRQEEEEAYPSEELKKAPNPS
jgi:hypothetical protein